MEQLEVGHGHGQKVDEPDLGINVSSCSQRKYEGERGRGGGGEDDSLDFFGKTLYVFSLHFFVCERFEMFVGVSKFC